MLIPVNILRRSIRREPFWNADRQVRTRHHPLDGDVQYPKRRLASNPCRRGLVGMSCNKTIDRDDKQETPASDDVGGLARLQ